MHCRDTHIEERERERKSKKRKRELHITSHLISSRAVPAYQSQQT